MKTVIKTLFNGLGFEVIRIKPDKRSKSSQEELSKKQELIVQEELSKKQELIVPSEENFKHKPLKFYETPIGNYYLPADAIQDVVAAAMREGEIFEPAVVDIARQYTKKGSIVLDLGANFGQMSLIFSQLVGEEGEVFSFEADDYIFYILEQNIEANNTHNIKPIFKAVYNKTGEKIFFPEPDLGKFPSISYGSYGLDLNATSGRTVETITIDALNIDKEISFMKVDIQGSDLFAMQGATETIKKHKMPIIFEFEKSLQIQKSFNTSFQDYLDFIVSIDYKVEEVINLHLDSINYLIVPDPRKN